MAMSNYHRYSKKVIRLDNPQLNKLYKTVFTIIFFRPIYHNERGDVKNERTRSMGKYYV